MTEKALDLDRKWNKNVYTDKILNTKKNKMNKTVDMFIYQDLKHNFHGGKTKNISTVLEARGIFSEAAEQEERRPEAWSCTASCDSAAV